MLEMTGSNLEKFRFEQDKDWTQFRIDIESS